MQQLSADEAALLKTICQRRGIDLSEIRTNRPIVECNMSGLNKFATMLMTHRTASTSIVVVGDYDVDGAVSTALMVRGLNALGFENVSYVVPKRIEEGYGLSAKLVERLNGLKAGILITVDNGIRAFEGTLAAKAAGWQVVITDHHLPSEEGLPQADLIVNPKINAMHLETRSQGAENLAGVGVAFYCLRALYQELIRQNVLSEVQQHSADPENWLDLVALGSVADMVPFDATNRALVIKGLRIMRAGKAVPGIQVLFKKSTRFLEPLPAQWISARTLACQVAPLINAAGRMDDIAIAVELLLAEDPVEIERRLRQLVELNQLRKKRQQQMLTCALNHVERYRPNIPAALTVADASFHLGIVGILASQIKTRYQRPVAVFGKISEDCWRGSIRSMPKKSLISFLEEITLQHRDHILQAGGHAFAAGVTLTDQGLKLFSAAFQRHAETFSSVAPIEPELTDGSLSESFLTLRTVKLLNYWISWGINCEEPCFEGEFFILEWQKIGQGGQKFLLRPRGGIGNFSAVTFNPCHLPTAAMREELYTKAKKFYYRLGINFFGGVTRLQLEINAIDWKN